MKNLAKILIYWSISILIVSSCKAYRNVENLKPSIPKEQRGELFDINSLAKLVESDKLIIKSKDSKTYHVYFTRIYNEKLMGTLWKENSKKLPTSIPFEMPVSDIETLWVERASAAATVPVVLVTSFALVIGVAFLVFAIGGGLDLGW